MPILKNSSEIKEAAGIFGELVELSAVVARKELRPMTFGAARSSFRPETRPSPRHRTISRPENLRPPEPPGPESKFRGDRLESVLFAMCKRGGFSGSVIVDSNGFPVAVYNSPVADELAAAFTMILGEAMEKGANLLKQTDANHMSIDINYLEKAVVRRFPINDAPYYLMAICPQDVDERSEIELSIEQVILILKKK